MSADQSRTPLPPSASADLSTRLAVTPSLPANAKWCQPGDMQAERYFLLRFDDPDRDDMIWTNEDAAREAWAQATLSWNCYLFGALPVAPTEAARGLAVTEEMVDAAVFAAYDIKNSGEKAVFMPEARRLMRAALEAALSRTPPPETVGGGEKLSDRVLARWRAFDDTTGWPALRAIIDAEAAPLLRTACGRDVAGAGQGASHGR